MRPLLDQSHLDVAWHAGQYQALPLVYAQNSALEIAWTRVVGATGTREGRMLAPFLTEGYGGFSIDDEDDFSRAEQLAAEGGAPIGAVERVKQHPGKMWVLDELGRLMRPLLDQSHLDVAWHAGQYQALPPVYAQNSALEIAWTRVVEATGTREGRMLAPFLTEGYEGVNIDDEDDFARAEQLVAEGRAHLVPVEREPYPG
jgi:CMP-N-acetylneuraminic acid synthetase